MISATRLWFWVFLWIGGLLWPGRIFAAMPAPQNQDESWVRLAVIVASSQGMGGDRPLRFAYRDGERLEKMLASVGQISPENLFLLKVESKDEFQATLSRIGKQISTLKENNRKVFLQFYYSGHGGARNFHFKDGSLSFDQVKESLGGDRADARVYVLDVCFGASFFTAKGFRTAPPLQLQLEMDRAAKGEVTISSSSGDEQAYEVRTLGGSIFTSHWIMALRGAGDVNRDGQVTLFEAYNYAYDRTAGYSAEALDKPQHPSYQIDLTGARDMMLARLLKGSTGILFQQCPAGLYNLLDLQRGIQIGELSMPEGEDFTLALEPGHYRIQYQAPKGKSLAANLEISPSSMTKLSFAAFTPLANPSSGMGISKGSSTLVDQEAGVDPAKDEDGGNDLRSRSPKIGFWSRIGYGAWYGAAGFNDALLNSRFNQTLEADKYFGFSGGFKPRYSRTSFGMDMDLSLPANWNLGLRVGYSSVGYLWNAGGLEPLNSLKDTLQGQYPVALSWSYDFSDLQVGAMIGRTFKLPGTKSLKLDGTFSYISRQINGNHTVTRPLYKTAIASHEDYATDGYRIDAGITYEKILWPKPYGRNFGLGLRLAPYFNKVNAGTVGPNPLHLASREFGMAATVSLNLLSFSGQRN